MTFAYLISAHKNPNQVLRLVNVLITDNAYCIIHTDNKTDEIFFKSVIGNRKNVFFCEHRNIVNPENFSVIEAIMELIREMIVRIGFPDYVHLLSGGDFPLKSNEYIFDYFERHKGTNFLEYFPLSSTVQDDSLERIRYNLYIEELLRAQKTHGFLPHIVPYGGSTWWSLTGECVSHIFSECNQGSELYEFYKHTLLSDKMLFHTFLMNSKYKDSVVNYNLRKTEWYYDGLHSKIWLDMDFDELITSPRLFAHKFDENKNDLILDKLETHICKKYKQKQTQNPVVSIVMVTCNAEKYLQETVNSIMQQTFINYEFIIVDNGSTDNSVNICHEFRDERISFMLCKHDYVKSLNTGLSCAKGKYIALMDAGDIMPIDRLEVQFEFMEKNPEIDICVGWSQFFGNNTHIEKIPSKHDEITNSLICRNFMIHSTAMLRRKRLCSKNIEYKADYPYAEDYRLWIDSIKAGFQFAGIQRILNYYRNNNERVIVAKYDEMSKSAFNIQIEYIEYLMEMMVKKNEKYYNLINSLVGAANKNLIPSRQLIDIVGSIHKAFLFKKQKQIANLLNENHQLIKKYLTCDYTSIIGKYKNVQYDENSIKMNSNVLPVWICWWDGEDAMPEIVKACFKSVCDNAGDHPVKLITKYNYHEFITVPDYIIEKASKGIISHTHLSDILRMCLIHDYGGLWLDATIFVTSTIKLSIFELDIVTIRNNSVCLHEPKYKWTTFFIGGRKGHPFFAYMRDMLLEYWSRTNELIDYFLTDYCIIIACDKIPVIRNVINKIPYFNPQVFELAQNLDKAFDSDIYEKICSDTDFHKLTWKKKFSAITCGQQTFYGYIINNLN
jgi:glycosyltransferase involved in cell wall biosynthesis